MRSNGFTNNAVYGQAGVSRLLMSSSADLLRQTGMLWQFAHRPRFDFNTSFRSDEKTYAVRAQPRCAGGVRAVDPLSIGSGQPSGGMTVQPLGVRDLSINYAIDDSSTLTFDSSNLTKMIDRDVHRKDVAPRDTRTYERTFAAARFNF